jgi:hypothetical protein
MKPILQPAHQREGMLRNAGKLFTIQSKLKRVNSRREQSQLGDAERDPGR